MAGRLIGKGSASSSTVASPSASRRTIERRVGSDKAEKTTSKRSGAVTVIAAVAPANISQDGYLTERLHRVKQLATPAHRPASTGVNSRCSEVRPRRIHVGSYRRWRSPG